MSGFELAEVDAGIAGTQFQGHVQYFPSVGSTNSLAMQAAQAGVRQGVWVADEQTAGRGRGGHGWHSAAGDGLYMSVLVVPRVSAVRALWISLATGLATRIAIAEASGLVADIRWPNDLLVGGRKCGGILVESAIAGAKMDTADPMRYAVIGVGINVNHESFPEELREVATSLRMEAGRKIVRERLLAGLLRGLDEELESLDAEERGEPGRGGLLERFAEASSWVQGKRVRVGEGDGYTGFTAGLGTDGFLRVDADDGTQRTVLSGGVRELKFLQKRGGRAKMLLALDVGNTNIVLGLYRLGMDGGDPEMVANWRVTTPSSHTADEFGLLLKSLFALRGLEMGAVDGIAIASVVPPLDSALRQMCDVYFRVKPLFIEPGVKTGVPVLTDNPSEVGADRIVNCVAGYERFRGPVIIVDMGTATKFDVVSKHGEFLGGAIAPGLGISAEALFSRAAKLPRVDVKKPLKVIGTGTVDNMQIGLYYGYIGLVDGILERMLAEMGPETKTIATGGLAPLIASGSKYIDAVDEMLTLTGLRIIYERNLDRHKRRGVTA